MLFDFYSVLFFISLGFIVANVLYCRCRTDIFTKGKEKPPTAKDGNEQELWAKCEMVVNHLFLSIQMNDVISNENDTMTLLWIKNNGIKFKCHDFYGGRFLILRNFNIDDISIFPNAIPFFLLSFTFASLDFSLAFHLLSTIHTDMPLFVVVVDLIRSWPFLSY